MINAIVRASNSDAHLAALVDAARDYAQIYLLAKQRQRGCDRGELMTLTEEFRNIVDDTIRHCTGKNYLSGACVYDIDLLAGALLKTK